MSNNRAHIDLCICTYQRPQILLTLRSIADLVIPEGCTLHIIVADNDVSPSAQVDVATVARELGLTLTYLHAPARNISIARNACLHAATGDYIAFIDDDEIISPDWLTAMLATFQTDDADIVFGPVRAVYPEGCADWLRQGDFHSTQPVWVKGHITTGYAGNVMMRRATPALQGLRFQEALGISGGEDTDFFQRAHAAGAHLHYASNALAFEGMSKERATLHWLLRRRWRFGQTHALTLRNTGRGGFFAIITASAKFSICSAMALLTLLHPVKKRHWLLRGTFHLAVACTLLAERS